jgi:RimJ/RimL family protein N-acetyltransferase
VTIELFGRARARSRRRRPTLGDVELAGSQVVLRPVTAADTPALVRIRRTPEVTAAWDDVDAEPDFPFDDPGAVPFSIRLGPDIVGMIQYCEEETPNYRHAGIDVFVDPAVHGRGIGRDAVRTLARYLIGVRGHHRLVIDPAADNVAAIACYAAVGFRPVGLMRRYERDPGGAGWHDGLLMDLVADELVEGLTPDQPQPG